MKVTTLAAIVFGLFFSAIAVACYVTKSGYPLFALLITPRISIDMEDED
jgi:hypothetical protein